MKNVLYWSSMAVFHEMASITTTSRQRKKRRFKIGQLQKWRWWGEQWRGVKEGHIWWWPEQQQRWWYYGLPRFHLKEQSQENRKWLLFHRQHICCLFFTATWTCALFVLHFSLLFLLYTISLHLLGKNRTCISSRWWWCPLCKEFTQVDCVHNCCVKMVAAESFTVQPKFIVGNFSPF